MQIPPVQYARSGDVSVAYRTAGEGPRDIVMVPGYISHLDVMPENRLGFKFFSRLLQIGRMTTFDKRGTGLSDPVEGVPTLEDRMDDVRAVMDAAGIERATLMGMSEGAPMSILFTATHPERVESLVLVGGMARSTWAPDYPWAYPQEALLESLDEFSLPRWGEGDSVDNFAPSLADDPEQRAWFAKLERQAVSPSMARKLSLMFFEVDVREVLPLIQVPTLVLHRKGDRVVSSGASEWMAKQIKGARFVELPGIDHMAFAGDSDAIVDEIEEFLTGKRSVPSQEFDRILATVMFSDIVGSTERAAAAGDRDWLALLERHNEVVRRELERFRGREVKTMGDGFMATFDGPARAIRCAGAMIEGVHSLGLQLRIGLHAGEVELLSDDDIGGMAVNIAARIGARAATDEVLVSSTVKDLVAGSGIQFEERGSHALKGVPGEWALHAVAGDRRL
ncbi:MAG TPA: adenylate/guanylate cyclase domain-containing protein [Candidatus Solibacter sp.]|nr:adenylate/guanylate cyclase domain-containing protein [Candidatus Solibacter sp.]